MILKNRYLTFFLIIVLVIAFLECTEQKAIFKGENELLVYRITREANRRSLILDIFRKQVEAQNIRGNHLPKRVINASQTLLELNFPGISTSEIKYYISDKIGKRLVSIQELNERYSFEVPEGTLKSVYNKIKKVLGKHQYLNELSPNFPDNVKGFSEKFYVVKSGYSRVSVHLPFCDRIITVSSIDHVQYLHESLHSVFEGFESEELNEGMVDWLIHL